MARAFIADRRREQDQRRVVELRSFLDRDVEIKFRQDALNRFHCHMNEIHSTLLI